MLFLFLCYSFTCGTIYWCDFCIFQWIVFCVFDSCVFGFFALEEIERRLVLDRSYSWLISACETFQFHGFLFGLLFYGLFDCGQGLCSLGYPSNFDRTAQSLDSNSLRRANSLSVLSGRVSSIVFASSQKGFETDFNGSGRCSYVNNLFMFIGYLLFSVETQGFASLRIEILCIRYELLCRFAIGRSVGVRY